MITEFEQRLNKVKSLRENNIEPYAYDFKSSHSINQVIELFDEKLKPSEKVEQVISVAGRVVALRNDGMFIQLQDQNNKLQIFTLRKELDEENKLVLKKIDRGDFIGIFGYPCKTDAGELSIRTKSITMLTKTLRGLPDKFHGLSNQEVIYRQRYLDTIISKRSKAVFETRSKIITELRCFLSKIDFLEVETPVFHPIPGGTTAKPFITHHNDLDHKFYLRIATELYLKKIVVGGFEKIFEIGRIFRNEGVSIRHNPEFTSIELYQAYKDYDFMMDLVQDIIQHLAKFINKSSIEWNGMTADISKPFRRIAVLDLIKEKTNLDFSPPKMTDNEAKKIAESVGLTIDKNKSWAEIVELVFETKCEKFLIEPTFVTDFPKEISPLVKIHRKDSRLAERADLYIMGFELAPIYSELTDPVEQKKRFEQQSEKFERGDDEAMHFDSDFILALEHGLPPLAGMGLGIDRLVMILTGAKSIKDVIFFPTLSSKRAGKI
ncbi:MAG: lysine--tRNA ligase [Alphaproteobacteria bacterium]|nr:lysine--tRNA ligase [Alphaproteobacteria bacterium]MBL0717779.1 lysine--tRNA ligase [Alphaproteobacteria bacterium]